MERLQNRRFTRTVVALDERYRRIEGEIELLEAAEIGKGERCYIHEAFERIKNYPCEAAAAVGETGITK